MKKSFYTESILYWVAKGIGLLAQRLPQSLCISLGAFGGTLAYHLPSRRRAIALGNLKFAFGDRYTHQQYRQILRKLYQHMGLSLMEVVRIPRMDKKYIQRWIAIGPGSEERLKAALSKGHGVIFLAAHFGNWELISIVGALSGYPTLVLAREQGLPRLNQLLNQYRESKGCRVISKGFPIRELIRGLKEGKIVGILADQDAGPHGVLWPLFGRLASTAPGAMALSLKTQAPILPVFIVRRDGLAHTLMVEEPLSIPEEGSLEERVKSGVASYLDVLERYVRQHPHQWLWAHRRWKSSPERRALLFSDGKAGHVRQGTALIQRMETAWGLRVQKDQRLQDLYSPSLFRSETVEISFRHPILKSLVSLVASVLPPHSLFGDFWLKLALTPRSYKALEGKAADIGVSCGSAVAPVNLLWAWASGARAVHIHSSRLPSWRRFHLAVIPEHDRPPFPPPSNCLVIDGALAPSELKDSSGPKDFRKLLSLSKPLTIGVLLGGPTRGVPMGVPQVKSLVEGLIQATEDLDAELLVTSSRRTPLPVEDYLRTHLKYPRCKLLVLVNRSHTGGLKEISLAVPCILNLSQLLVVSGDSISMVSEALASGRPVVSFLPRTNGLFGLSKHHRFLQGLQEQGKVVLAMPEEVGKVVLNVASRPSGPPLSPSALLDPVEEFLIRWL